MRSSFALFAPNVLYLLVMPAVQVPVHFSQMSCRSNLSDLSDVRISATPPPPALGVQCLIQAQFDPLTAEG